MQRRLNKAALHASHTSKLVSSSSAFLPSSITNLWSWYDLNDITTLFTDLAGTTPVVNDLDPIGYIADKSGNGRYVRQTGATTTRPTYSVNIQNSKPGALFDGGDYLDSVATVDSFPLTIIGVSKRVATVGANQGLVGNYHGTTFGIRVRFNSTNFLVSTVGPSAISSTGTIALGANTPFIFGFRCNSTNITNITNTELINSSHSASVANNLISLGRLTVNAATSLLIGYICETCVYNRDLSDLEISQLTTYLNSKWGVY